MGTTCLGCGKAIGGVLGAYGKRLLYGEVCLTCYKKLGTIPNNNFLTPTQIKDVISGRVNKEDVKVSTSFVEPGEASTNNKSAVEEIREYKALLDEGIITQEEFETVKRRLMNI